MFEFDPVITLETIINAVSIILSVFGGVWAAVTSTKKYELTENLRQEIMGWYSSTVSIMIELIHLIQNEPDDEEFDQRRYHLLSRLSTQIEIGRFYFPNLDKKSGYGSYKAAAYKGFRNVILDFPVQLYRYVEAADCREHVEDLWEIERDFTSSIFELLNTVKRNKLYSRQTNIRMCKGETRNDFLDKKPEKIHIFMK